MRHIALGLALAPFAVFASAAAGADQVCPRCEKPVPGDYRFCPYDGSEIPDPTCAKCERKMRRDWRFCPFDGTAIGPRLAAPGAAPAPAAAAVPAPAATPAPAAVPAAPPAAPRAPLVETLPRPGAAPVETRLREPEGERRSKSPYDTVEDLFRAIAAGDEAWIRRLYAWPRFFPKASEGEMDAEIDGYVKRLVERVRPTLAGRERRLSHIALGRADATITVELRDIASRAVVSEYEFKLADEGKGWAIVAIKP